jgi:hypothetical protein
MPYCRQAWTVTDYNRLMAPSISPSTQARFHRLADDLRRVFGQRFVALVAYGPRRGAAFATQIGPDDLDALAPLVETWHRDHLATPLVMTPDELRRSLDAFPLEFQTMLDSHVLIDGADPFAGVRIDTDDLRRACEVQAKSHVVHLRQGWLEAHGHSEELGHLAERSAGPFRALLAQAARLSGEPADTDDQIIAFAERAIHLPADLGRDLLHVLHVAQPDNPEAPASKARLAARLGEYLAATERLWALVDGWTPR